MQFRLIDLGGGGLNENGMYDKGELNIMPRNLRNYLNVLMKSRTKQRKAERRMSGVDIEPMELEVLLNDIQNDIEDVDPDDVMSASDSQENVISYYSKGDTDVPKNDQIHCSMDEPTANWKVHDQSQPCQEITNRLGKDIIEQTCFWNQSRQIMMRKRI